MRAERKIILERLRLEQLRREAAMTPAERLAIADRLLEFARKVSPGATSRTDESREFLLALRARRRA
jgi:hypothetical protein